MTPGDAESGRGQLLDPTDPVSALELHAGLLLEGPGRSFRSTSSFDPFRQLGHPRAALENSILSMLEEGPCVVYFSGGRDSSLVLALAITSARRAGLPLPRALSVRYRDSPATDESQWQELVTDHLGVPLEVVEVARGDDELAAPLAISRLRRYGPIVPAPTAVSLARIAAQVTGHVVLTGEAGDEVLGPSRITGVTAHWRWRRRPTVSATLEVVSDLLPRPIRRLQARRRVDVASVAPWLIGDARRVVHRELVERFVARPLDWRHDRREFAESRMVARGLDTMSKVARAEGFEIRHPLIDPRFLDAWCSFGGRWGLTSRTEAMRVLGDHVLPEAVLARRGKAGFNEVYASARVRRFAHQWDGGGIDPDLADIEQLREAWTSEVIPATSLVPLQLALISAIERGWEPDL